MSSTNMFSAGLGAAGLGVVFPAMCNVLEVGGLGVGVNDFGKDEDPPCSFCKDSCSSGNKRSIPGFLQRMVSSFLTFVMLTLMSRVPRSSSAIAPSKEMTLPLNHIPPLLPSERILDLFLPVKYPVIRL